MVRRRPELRCHRVAARVSTKDISASALENMTPYGQPWPSAPARVATAWLGDKVAPSSKLRVTDRYFLLSPDNRVYVFRLLIDLAKGERTGRASAPNCIRLLLLAFRLRPPSSTSSTVVHPPPASELKPIRDFVLGVVGLASCLGPPPILICLLPPLPPFLFPLLRCSGGRAPATRGRRGSIRRGCGSAEIPRKPCNDGVYSSENNADDERRSGEPGRGALREWSPAFKLPASSRAEGVAGAALVGDARRNNAEGELDGRGRDADREHGSRRGRRRPVRSSRARPDRRGGGEEADGRRRKSPAGSAGLLEGRGHDALPREAGRRRGTEISLPQARPTWSTARGKSRSREGRWAFECFRGVQRCELAGTTSGRLGGSSTEDGDKDIRGRGQLVARATGQDVRTRSRRGPGVPKQASAERRRNRGPVDDWEIRKRRRDAPPRPPPDGGGSRPHRELQLTWNPAMVDGESHRGLPHAAADEESRDGCRDGVDVVGTLGRA
ncbi:hypothetical protein THAOC_05362 [Thalassiosira oceanica]|uniref:Uncharacterized protein n=1 Tax=Thalassiosira oceanica TaxID=159749 RepID=K0T7E6_THAOC|nr:hypothetical protein THAOC_05362 [Thalassiosira oceanica]|eukprot:EJK73044.1 hypothetical protein THAOC_05362 [Thalassiosira oceanica]